MVENILSKNEKVLRERYAGVWEDLQKEAYQTLFTIEEKQARDGMSALSVTKEDKLYRLNSAYQPIREAKKWVEQYDLKNLHMNIFMFGLGNGIFVRELLKEMPQDAHLFLWEPDYQIFSYVIKNVDIADILSDDRLHLVFEHRKAGAYSEAITPFMNWSTIPTQVICIHPSYEKIYTEEYELFKENLRRAVDKANVDRNTSAFFAKAAMDNMLSNLRYMKNSNYIGEYIDKMNTNVPAIIVAAGPSLEKNIEELRKAKDKAFILVVDTALRYIHKKGIAYDVMVTSDPKKPIEYFTEVPECKEMPLFCTMTSNKEITSFHTGKKVWCSADLFFKDVLSDEFGISFENCIGGGSVATFAFDIAVKLGFKNVILVGQDFAYEGDVTHVGGEQSHIRNEEEKITLVEGIHGDMVKTRWDWNYYRTWYEEWIRTHEGVTVIDATEGGALIHGTKVMTLKDALAMYTGEEFRFDTLLQEIPATFDDKKYQKYCEVMKHVQKELRNVKRKAEEGKQVTGEYLQKAGRIPEEKKLKLVKEIRKINHYIMLQKYASSLLDFYCADLAMEALKHINKVEADANLEEYRSVQNADVVYGAYIDGAETLDKMFGELINEL